MKAIVLERPRSPLTISEVAQPECAPDGAVLEVGACGVCRSDWHVWEGGWAWEAIRPALPVILGHEMSGTVVEVGDDVREVRVGDRVIVPFHFACGSCEHCHTNRSNACLHARFPGSDTDGGFAEYIAVPVADFNCIPIPDALAMETAASLGCRYMTAWRAIAVVGEARPGETGVVVGCGGLGLSMIQIGTALGMEMIAVDIDDRALARAREAGASMTLDARDGDISQAVEQLTAGGADISFDAVGRSDAAISGIRSLRSRGRHVQVGLTSADDAGAIAWPADRIVFRELQIRGSIGNSRPDYGTMLRLIERGVLRPDELLGEIFEFEDVVGILPELGRRALDGLSVARIGNA